MYTPKAKPTKATLKSFVSRHAASLQIRCRARFDGMTDGLEFTRDAKFKPVDTTASHKENTLGIAGVWLVHGSRNFITPFAADGMVGYSVSNCCGYFTVAIPA